MMVSMLTRRSKPGPEPGPSIDDLDIEMPGPDGLEVARKLGRDGFGGRIVIVTTFGRPGYLAAAMAAGASGFLLKDAPAAIQKLGARNRAEAVQIAERKGWL
jgi:two-component system, NarL family, response regulator DesR